MQRGSASSGGAENEPPSGQQQQLPAQLPWLARAGLTVDVHLSSTPGGGAAVPPPVSCPSRLQVSPSRRAGAAFDPFAPPDDCELPGCTPLCPGPAHAAPPAVGRKPGVPGGSPVAPPPPPAPFPAGGVQSCPPQRSGRRAARPLLRVRVKRSLTGAVAAAAGPLAPRALNEMPPQLLAGCSRKRFEADLLSPPLPRKSSRTLLDDQHLAAAEMMARLQLASGGAGGCGAGTGDAGGSSGVVGSMMEADGLAVAATALGSSA